MTSCGPPPKAMYKLEPAVALGGEVVIYAPHLDVVSHVHGKYIYEVGYHILPYFLNDWERYQAHAARRAGAQHARARLGRDGRRASRRPMSG